MKNLKYSEILRKNKEFETTIGGLTEYKIVVLSNIITAQLNEIIEYSIRSEGINAKATSGNYDNLIQDSLTFANSDLVIVFFEAANFIDGLQYKANVIDDNALTAAISKAKTEIDFLFENLKNTSLVIFNKFSSLVFNHNFIKANNFDKICNELNEYLIEKKRSNFILLDIDKVISKISIDKSVDFRYFYSSKALYTIEFYKTYSYFVNSIVRSIKGKAKKAIVFDCDNTFWKGILGEDGMDKIEMSGKTRGGIVFEEVQNLALELSKKGIIIGLCSKNNFEDVEKVINNHPDMSIRNENIAIKKINWDDKLSNLKSIAQELNIGLDSIVFVDDSDFEVGLIKDHLKEVTVLKAPANIYEYPTLIRDNFLLFYSISETEEDLKRIEMYKKQVKRESEKNLYSTIETYLASLELTVIIHLDNKNIIPRIAQMTQKTNQFNLTSKRYTELDIENFTKKEEFSVFAFGVADKYGDSGITGLSILKIDNSNKNAIIDTLLMSCRIIGRNIELAFFDFLINYLNQLEIKSIEACYVKSMKNEQVSGFYENLGFKLSNSEGAEKIYKLELSNYNFQNINYIKINHGRKN